jgi:hypothetical protein
VLGAQPLPFPKLKPLNFLTTSKFALARLLHWYYAGKLDKQLALDPNSLRLLLRWFTAMMFMAVRATAHVDEDMSRADALALLALFTKPECNEQSSVSRLSPREFVADYARSVLNYLAEHGELRRRRSRTAVRYRFNPHRRTPSRQNWVTLAGGPQERAQPDPRKRAQPRPRLNRQNCPPSTVANERPILPKYRRR